MHEYLIGHDGTWVSHEYFGKIALNIFKKDNQLENKLSYFGKYPDLIASPVGPKSKSCLKNNVKRCLKYISSYLQGVGTVTLITALRIYLRLKYLERKYGSGKGTRFFWTRQSL